MATLLKHTVKPTGGDFDSLDACVDHLISAHDDFVDADVYGEVEISGDWSGVEDTSLVTLAGLNLDATRYLSIYTDETNKAGLSWDDNKYRLVCSNPGGKGCISKTAQNTDYVRIHGLQIGLSSINQNYDCLIFLDYTTDDNCMWWISNCFLKGVGTTPAYRHPGLYVGDSQISLKLWNTVICNIGGSEQANSDSCLYVYAASTVWAYNCTMKGGTYGVHVQTSGTVHAKSVYCGGQSGEGFYRQGGTLNKTNCGSSDSSADDTGTGETASNCQVNVAVDTDTFVNVTAGSEDFHLAADGNSPLEDAGYNNSGESSPLNYEVDMDGHAMVHYSIGADDGVVTSGLVATVHHVGHGMQTGDKVLIKGASLPENNGVFTIVRIDADHYKYTMGSNPGSSPTGTITATFVVLEGTTHATTGVLSMTRVFPTDQPVVGWARKSSSVPYYKEGPLAGVVDSEDGASFTAVLSPDA